MGSSKLTVIRYKGIMQDPNVFLAMVIGVFLAMSSFFKCQFLGRRAGRWRNLIQTPESKDVIQMGRKMV